MGPFRRHYTGRRDFATLVIDMERSRIEKISKALADQPRLKIFEAISARTEMNCGEIVAMRGVTPATVSHHLKILADAGLIQCRRHGQFGHKRAIPEAIAEYSQAPSRLTQGTQSPHRELTE